MTTATIEAPEVQGSYAHKALLGSAVGYAAELHLTHTQAGSLVTWTLVGAVAGGVIFGMLSDYLGRVRVLTWTILLFAVFTGLCGLAQGYWDLLA